MKKIRKKLLLRQPIGGIATALFLVVMVIVSTGCQREPSPPATSDAAKTDPKAMFDEFYKAFHHELTSDLPHFQTTNDGGFSSLATKRIVSHELIPPTDTDSTYRAKIFVKTKTKFTFRPSRVGKEEGGGNSDKKTSESEGSSDFGLPKIGNFDVTAEPEVAVKSKNPFSQAPLPPQENVDEQVYELAFENDRWVLKTDPDPDSEQFIKATFDYVLGRQ